MKASRTSSSRLYYLDWLRVLAIIGVFLFHNARFYDSHSDWHVKNASLNAGASFVVGFMGQWIMPLFFLISGAGTYYALKSRRVSQFLQDRALRLFIPMVFGMLLIVVPQAYFQALYQGADLSQYNLIEIYILYLQSLPDLNWFHLWFLVYLFVYTLVTLPLFMSRKGKPSLASRAAGSVGNQWVLPAAAVVVIGALNILVYPDGFWGDRGSGGWNILANFVFFVFGYLLYASERSLAFIKRLGWVWLGGAIVAAVVLLAFLSPPLEDPPANFGSIEFVVASVVQAAHSWLWIFAIVALAARFLSGTNRFLVYGNEAVLPFYILHQTVIVSIGYYVVQWSAGVGIKYLVISTTSFVAIMVLYEAVRRFNVLRFLFGMRLLRRSDTAAAREAEKQA
jgi:glucans biosynthesis protein C